MLEQRLGSLQANERSFLASVEEVGAARSPQHTMIMTHGRLILSGPSVSQHCLDGAGIPGLRGGGALHPPSLPPSPAWCLLDTVSHYSHCPVHRPRAWALANEANDRSFLASVEEVRFASRLHTMFDFPSAHYV